MRREETRMKKIEFPKGINTILQKINDSGFEAYVVGGAIRDILMVLKPKDYDITTNANPMNIIRIFSVDPNYMVKFIDAESYQIVSVNGIEIATYRKDIHENGETIETIPVQTLDEDLMRRDFTINAMAAGLDGKLIDRFGGQEDLKNGIVRFVGEPRERICEDPNRIIRAARFAAQISGGIYSNSLEAIIEKVDLVPLSIAPERIRLEIIKAMSCEHPSIFFEFLFHIGALKYILPSLHDVFSIEGGEQHRETVFDHSMMTGDYIGQKYRSRCRENPMLRLAAYLHDVGKSEPTFKDGVIHFYGHQEVGAEIIERDLKALTFTNKEIKYIVNLTLVHMQGGMKMSPKSTRKLIARLEKFELDYKDWLDLRVADRAGNQAKEPYTEGRIQKFAKKFTHEYDPTVKEFWIAFDHKALAMSGTRIQELLNIGPSQIIGVILQHLLDRVISEPELNTPEKLTEIIIGKQKKKD